MKKKLLSLMVFFTAIFFSCERQSNAIEDKTNPPNELSGILEKPEATFYQYGTHILVVRPAKTYALRSSTINLDAYINNAVTITGEKVAGYPLDGGPDYIDVKTIK